MPFDNVRDAKAFYDRFGAKQDTQAFYEDPACELLVRWGELDAAHRVFELGCGTGRLAYRLLKDVLPADARYTGVDVSTTMVSLARKRLAPFGPRAEIWQTEGSMTFSCPDASFDRFISTYVLDLLPEETIREALAEARRILCKGGLLCTAALTYGRRLVPFVVSRVWAAVHAVRPGLVGGCRPTEISRFLSTEAFAIKHHEVVSSYGIPSEILVATAR